MPLFFLRRHAWWFLLLACTGFVAWTNSARIRRIEYVTGVGREAAAPAFPASAKFRYLIVPEHLNGSYAWIAQTQQMIEEGKWRVRHTDAENAPFGREVHAASPYRWWLGLVTLAVHRLTGQPLGAATERAALFADPALHVLLLVVSALLLARWFGPAAAAVGVLSLTFLFPLGAGFLPAVPEDFSLILFLTPWCLLLLLVPLLRGPASLPATPGSNRPVPRPHGWFLAAGCIGALGLWLNVAVQVPVLAGIAVGGVLVAFCVRRSGSAPPLPAEVWRWWGLGGAATVLLAYLVEYAPAHLGGWELRALHPIYAIAWLGAAEVLTRLVAWIQREPAGRSWRDYLALVLGLAAAASLPVLMWRMGNLGFLNVDLLAFRLTKQTEGVHAPNLFDWFSRQGLTAPALAVLAPLGLLAIEAWLAFRRVTPAAARAALTLSLGALAIAVPLAGFQLRWWQTVQALALPGLVATLVGFCQMPAARWARATWLGGFAVCLLLGASQLVPRQALRGQNVLTVAEVEGLVERDLAHSLARRVAAGREAVVLAPPGVGAALHFYAGIRGLSSLAWENKAGLSVALRIVISTSREEAQSLVQNRGVTHLIVPSWDPFFDT
ncbi:MAG: hypothetical protein ABIZ49_04970, partial [Opitutaceae bacterium]